MRREHPYAFTPEPRRDILRALNATGAVAAAGRRALARRALEIFACGGPHMFPAPAQERILEWFDRWV